MTWAELFLFLKSMEEQNHTAFNEKVTLHIDGVYYTDVDIVESLRSGSVLLIPTVEDDDGED